MSAFKPNIRIKAALSLDDREREILIRIADGKPQKVIADELGLQMNSMSSHFIKRIYEKLHVTNNIEATRVAVAAGLV